MTTIPTGANQWLHLESGATIADDGAAALTLTIGARVVVVPPQYQAVARARLGHLPPAPPPALTPEAIRQIGGEIWKPERTGM